MHIDQKNLANYWLTIEIFKKINTSWRPPVRVSKSRFLASSLWT